jgi:hypothetical protein
MENFYCFCWVKDAENDIRRDPPRAKKTEKDGFENTVQRGWTPKAHWECDELPRKPKGARTPVWGSQVAPTCFSCRFNYFISFAKFLKVTWHLAVVMKAISSLVPFPSVSYYAANTGWLALLHSTKLRATLAHPLFNQCYPCHKLKSLHKIKFQEAKIDFEHISFYRNLVPCGIIEK